MNKLRSRNFAFAGWIGVGIIALLVVGSGLLGQTDNKKKEQNATPPARTAPPPQPVRNTPPPQPVRSAPPPQPARNTPPPQPVRNAPPPQPVRSATPAPVYHSPAPNNGANRPAPNLTNPNPGRQPNAVPNPGYQPNVTGNPGRQPNTQPNPSPSNTPNIGRQPGSQPNSGPANVPGTGHPTNMMPAPSHQPNIQPNPGPANSPGTGRQPTAIPNPGHQPNLNPNPGTRVPNSGGMNAGSRGGATVVNPSRLPPGQFTRNPNGTATFRGANNTEAHFRRDGSIREVHARNMVITHGPAGTRRVVAERGDHRVVLSGHERGYVERSFRVGDHEYSHRTYFAGGHEYTHVYRSYAYGGVYYQAYVPAFYYGPTFYSWAYSPWRSPVAFRWGWAGSPWVGFYGGYFAPYPVYASPVYWLTDYILSATLEQAYQERMDAAAANAQAQAGYSDSYAPNSGQALLSPDVKQAIADEVQRQLAIERAEAQVVARNPNGDPGYAGAPPLFSDYNQHVFLVSSNLDVATVDGQECAITYGDVLAMNGASAPNATAASVKVLASKGQDCQQNSFVLVSLVDLQEMQNQMRETIDQGLGDLQAHKGGLPKPPGDALRGQVQSPLAGAAPAPDSNALSELSQEEQQATQAEQEVVGAQNLEAGAGSADSGSTGPVTISLNQTIADVTASLGPPATVVDLGAKRIYVYKNMKVTFTNGRVSDVQ